MQAKGGHNRVSTYRKAQGLTQQALADQIGTHRVHLARVEAGLQPSPALAQKLADFFQTTVSAVFPNKTPAASFSAIPDELLSRDDRVRLEEVLRQRKSVLVTGWDLPYIGNVLCELAEFVVDDNGDTHDVAFIDTTHSLALPDSVHHLGYDAIRAQDAAHSQTPDHHVPLQRRLVEVALQSCFHTIVLHDTHFELAQFPSLTGVQFLASMRASTPHQALAALTHGKIFAGLREGNREPFNGHIHADDYAAAKHTIEKAFDLIVHHAWNRLWLMTPRELFVPGANPWTTLSLN